MRMIFFVSLCCLLIGQSIRAEYCQSLDYTSFTCNNVKQFHNLRNELQDAKVLEKISIVNNNGFFDLSIESANYQEDLKQQIEELDLSQAGQVSFNDGKGLSGLHGLTKLNISHCQLTLLKSSYFPPLDKQSLENLDASWNAFQELSSSLMDSWRTLRYANFSHNSLQIIQNGSFEQMTELEYLNVDKNQLRNITFGYAPSMKVLIFSNNLLESLTGNDYAAMPKLEEFNLHANALRFIAGGIFHGFGRLRYLNMSFNSLPSLPSDIFCGLKRLIELDLASNELLTIDVGAFRPLRKLQYLDLNSNNLVSLLPDTFDGLVSLRQLYLQNNNLENIADNTFAHFKLLDTLDLSRNNLEDLNWNMFGTEILPRMRKFLAVSNNLEKLHPLLFAQLPNLEYLALGNNNLKVVDVRNFAGLTGLRKLYLGHNLLEVIPEDVLYAIDNVTDLFIEGNRLTFLYGEKSKFPNLRRVAIEGNPWQCPCLEELQNWLNQRKVEYIRSQSPFYKGQSPICVVTKADYCVMDLNLIREHEIVDKFEDTYDQNM